MSESKSQNQDANTQSAGTVEFHVSRGAQALGAWSLQEIAARLARSEIVVTDFIFDPGAMEWIPLLEFAPMKDVLRANKPKAPPQSAALQPHSAGAASPPPGGGSQVHSVGQGEWFVRKGANRFGPYSSLGLIKALQEKTIFEFDSVWRPGMDTWQRIAEVEEFHEENIRARYGQPGSKDVFQARQFPRAQFQCEIIAHDNRSMWMGHAFQIGVGGSGLVIHNSTLVPGQTLLLHFSSTEKLPAFNTTAEIVSKKFQKVLRGPRAAVTYGVRFVKIDSEARSNVVSLLQDNSTSARSEAMESRKKTII